MPQPNSFLRERSKPAVSLSDTAAATDDELSARITVFIVARSARQRERHEAVEALASLRPRRRRHLSYQEFERTYGVDDQALNRIATYARGQGLEVLDDGVRRPMRGVAVAGALGDLGRIFGVSPRIVTRGPWAGSRTHFGPVNVPREILEDVLSVFGLDELPVDEPHLFQVLGPRSIRITPREVARHYDFPRETGHGQKVAIIELGGGYHSSDLASFFREHKLNPPRIVCHGILDATSRPASIEEIVDALKKGRITDSIVWTIEATMDIELVAALANAAEIHVYFAPRSREGKCAALEAAMAEGCSVVSLSWGAGEWRLAASGHLDDVDEFESLLEAAALQGVTVCCSSGDIGQIEYPASSPCALGCGGTRLHDKKGRVVPETTWSEVDDRVPARRFLSGGGISTFFPRVPRWQGSADIPRKTGESGRGVPDVAAKADLATGYACWVAGMPLALGATSAAAPLWASLIARCNEHLAQFSTRVGWLTPLLYSDAAFEGVLRNVSQGYGGTYRACAGWDPCTGLGTPDGARLLRACSTL